MKKTFFIAFALFARLSFASSGPGIIPLPGSIPGVYTNTLLINLDGSGTTNTIYYTNANTAFGPTNGTHIQYNTTSNRWFWMANFTAILATNDFNRPTGTWHKITNGGVFSFSRFLPRGPGTIDVPSPSSGLQTTFTGTFTGTLGTNTMLTQFIGSGANVFYVSKGGSDSNDGKSQNTAFLTLAKAHSTVIGIGNKTNTIVIYGGTYNEQLVVTNNTIVYGVGAPIITSNNVTMFPGARIYGIRILYGMLTVGADPMDKGTWVEDCEVGNGNGDIDGLYYRGVDFTDGDYVFKDSHLHSSFDGVVFDFGAGDASVHFLNCRVEGKRTQGNNQTRGYFLTGGLGASLVEIYGGAITISNTLPYGAGSDTNCCIYNDFGGQLRISNVVFDYGQATNGTDIEMGAGGFPPIDPQRKSVYAAGAPYTMTGSAAQVVFGTTSPTMTFTNGGTYELEAKANLIYSNATYAATSTATIKLRKTSGTAADVANATRTIIIPIATTSTNNLGQVSTPCVQYIARTGDVIQMYGLLGATPSVGAVRVDSAEIFARRIR